MFHGDTIGKYRLVRRLAQGGMGEVWLATASGYGGFTKNVVLKTLLPEHACDPLFIEMLAHEARVCAQLSHPNLIEVFDFTEHGGIYLLAMEHVMGRPLHHIMKAARACNVAVPAWFALRVAWECCRGLECAHDQGVIHCDLSPSNVIVAFTGVTKILDFGVAHSIARGPKADRLKGKFAYMAPERIRSLATDCRTDIYSLGVMLYLLFTGQLPLSASSDAELLHKIVHTRPRPPGELAPIDARIENLIQRAIQRDPARRYQNIRELLADLSPCLEGQLGAYGQHDVARFVGQLFESPATEVGGRALPAIPSPPGAATSDVVTCQPSVWFSRDEVRELEVLDIEIESSVLEIPQEVPAEQPPGASPARIARGSSSIAPLVNLGEPDRKPLESLTKLFADPQDVQETRTTVQSLFESRATALAFEPSRIFDRPRLAAATDPEPAGVHDAAPPAAAVIDELAGATGELERRDHAGAERADELQPQSRPGGFGSYSSTRPSSQSAWPWASSRTKPD